MVSNFYISDQLNKFTEFCGVFAANNINKDIFKNKFKTIQFLVVNTEEIGSGKEGHWLSLCRYLDKNGKVILEYFDSLAWPFENVHENIKQTIINSCFDVFIKNNKILQHPKSNFCGFYVIARFLSLVSKITINDFLACFSRDLEKSDDEIIKYIKKLNVVYHQTKI